MDWIFDNLQIVIVVGSTIAWWLTQRKQEGEDAPPPTDRPGREKIDVEQLERNRRLREEIRRKRAERQEEGRARSGNLEPRPGEVTMARRSSVPEPVQREPSREPDPVEQIPPVLRELMGIPEPQPRPAAPVPPPIPENNPVWERQERMREEMAELEAKRKQAAALAAKAAKASPYAQRQRRKSRRQASGDSLANVDFLATLRDPRQARRAIVLREVLDKPVGLR